MNNRNESESQLRSPNEMIANAKRIQLGGREPETREDWASIMNFLAYNIHHAAALPACLLMRTMYEIPLTDHEVKEIVCYQLEQRSQEVVDALPPDDDDD